MLRREWPGGESLTGLLAWPWYVGIIRDLKLTGKKIPRRLITKTTVIPAVLHTADTAHLHGSYFQLIHCKLPSGSPRTIFFLQYLLFSLQQLQIAPVPGHGGEAITPCRATFPPQQCWTAKIWDIFRFFLCCRDYSTSDGPAKPAFMILRGWKSPSSLRCWTGLRGVPLEDICLESELSADRRLTATTAWDNHSWEMKSAVRQTNSIKIHSSMKYSMDTDVRKYWFRWSVLASFLQWHSLSNNPPLKRKASIPELIQNDSGFANLNHFVDCWETLSSIFYRRKRVKLKVISWKMMQ